VSATGDVRARKGLRDATFLRILVEGRAGTGVEEVAIAAAVAAVLSDPSLGREWRVGRLFEPVSEDDELARFYAVTGMVDAYALPQVAWEISYRLADALGDLAVEVIPDLPSSLGAPPPAPEARPMPAPMADLPHEWALSSIRAQPAWGLSPPAGGAVRGAGIRIGHPDTGYVLHPDYELAVVDRGLDRDVIDGDDDATDPLEERFGYQPGHGTRTGSVIAGRGSGTLTGVAPAATLVPIRTVKSVVQFFDGDVARAVHYARSSACHVVSMSLGGLGFRGLEAAIDRAVREGMIVMAAAGNQLDALGHAVVWPARYRNCIAVAAVNSSDRAWAHSSRGSKVAVSAPGEAVWVPDLSFMREPPVEQSSGTSYAVAHLAGAAALWLAFHGRRNLIDRYGPANLQTAFLTVLRETARKPRNWEAGLGAGIVDAERLLRAQLPPPGARAAAEPSEPEEDELHVIFPELEPDAVEKRMRELVPAAPADARLRTLRRELLYLLTENPELRSRLVARERGVAPTAAVRDALLPHASPTLAASLGAPAA
jgi:subtilisin family serine protease